MENLRIDEKFELYREICKEAGLEWSIDGWKFFDQVMFPDYMKYCELNSVEPSRKAFKRNCILIAFDMIEEAKQKAC